MKTYRILAFAVVLGLAGTSLAQLSFDFEGVTLQDLIDGGWVLIDDQTHDVGGVPTQYLGTIQLETTIVHSGSQALRLAVWDIAYFPVNGEFGTLDLWAYDFGYQIEAFITTAYGPRFGLRKFGDIDTSGYFPANEPVDYGLLNRPYGIGAGLLQKSWLGSDDGYATEWGATAHLDIAVIGSPNADYDPADPAVNAGWAGDQSWFSATWLGFLPGGRPDFASTGSGGWNHWRIAYLAPGQVEIELLASWAGDNRAVTTGTPSASFDGLTPGGIADIFLFGGSSLVSGAEPDTWFGDGIYDDITWTPVATAVPGDADGDGDVDLDDFVILKNEFGTTAPPALQADFDGDGDVDLDDFVILKSNFGT